MDRALIGGVFLTGGGAKLPDLCDVAEEILQCQTRFGLPMGIRELAGGIERSGVDTAAGLAMYSAKLKQQARCSGNAPAGWERY